MAVQARAIRRRVKPAAEAPARPSAKPAKVADLWLGIQLRSLRKAKEMSLQQVADAAELSIGMVSQIERGLASPSIRSLRKLAEALGVPISWFFHANTGRPEVELRRIVRREDRRQLRLPKVGSTHELGIFELLTPDLSGDIELLLMTMEPGFDSGPVHQHRGEEAGLVLTGAMALWVGDDHFIVNQGDSFRFSSQDPHRYANASDRTTRVCWALTPPLL
ncbi:MAG: cupin domain-containing protein [Alphaproteobacteria bacterium]|nr:cupin domain-containing protein [Alphaproteobacteria bacterium]